MRAWLTMALLWSWSAVSAAQEPPRAQPLPPPVTREPVMIEPPPAQPLPVRGRPPLRTIPPAMPAPAVRRDAGAPLLLGLGGTTKWHHDRGYERVSENGGRKGGLELFAAYDVVQFTPRLILSLGGTYRVTAGARLRELEYAEHELLADVALRFRALSWLAPQVRASGGLVSTRVELEDRATDATLVAHDRDLTAGLGAGLLVHTPSRTFENRRGRRASLVLGLLVEGGYVFAPRARLRTDTSEREGLEQAGVSLGSLSRTAPSFRMAGFLRF